MLREFECVDSFCRDSESLRQRLSSATNWNPLTFAKGWRRGGVVALTVPGVQSKLQLVMVVITHGHYEVTLSAIVESFAKSRGLLENLTNTLLSRMTSTTSKASRGTTRPPCR